MEPADLPARLATGVMYVVALVLSVCVHEFGHAVVADKLGDPLPRAQGRVTLNPLAHVDPVGTLLLPMIAVLTGIPVLGWGRPVQISLAGRALTRRLSVRTIHALISLAGPLMNLALAFVLSAALVATLAAGAGLAPAKVLFNMIAMNIGLALFNLLPVPPLDGGAVLRAVLPRRLDPALDLLDRYGGFVLLALFATGALAIVTGPAMWLSRKWAEILFSVAKS